jgi:hypothetical protein
MAGMRWLEIAGMTWVVGTGTRWVVVVEGKQHLVELRIGYKDAPAFFVGASGKVVDRVLVDDEVVKEWNSSVWRGPKQVSFTISGEPAILVRKGIWDWRHFCFDTHGYELFFKGEKAKSI